MTWAGPAVASPAFVDARLAVIRERLAVHRCETQREPKRLAFCGASGTGKSTLATRLAQELGLDLNPVGSRSTARAMGFDNPYDVDKACLATYVHYVLSASRWTTAIEGETYGYTHVGQLVPRIAALQTPAGPHVQLQLAASWARAAWGKPADSTTNRAHHGQSVRAVFQTKLHHDKIAWERAHAGFVTDRTPLDDLVYAWQHCPAIVTPALYLRATAHLATYDLIVYCPLDAGQWLAGDAAREADPMYHRMFDHTLMGLLHRNTPQGLLCLRP